MTAPVAPNNNQSPNGSTPTPFGSRNSDPQLVLSRSSGAGYNNAGYDPGNRGYTAGTGAEGDKYATYLKLFSGEMFKAYEVCLHR